MRGRGGRTNQAWEEKDKGTTHEARGGHTQRGGRNGGGRGSGIFIGRCFHCNEVGHQYFRCPKWIEPDQGKERRVHLIEEEETHEPKAADPEVGEFLLMRKGGPLPTSA